MFEGGDYSIDGGAWKDQVGGFFKSPYLHTLLLVVILVIVIIMMAWDQDLELFRKKYTWAKQAGFGNREGLQFLGATHQGILVHREDPKDPLAVQALRAQQAMTAEKLIESGRDPNLYFTPVQERVVDRSDETVLSPGAVGVAAGFRDRMAGGRDEEELAKYLGK